MKLAHLDSSADRLPQRGSGVDGGGTYGFGRPVELQIHGVERPSMQCHTRKVPGLKRGGDRGIGSCWEE